MLDELGALQSFSFNFLGEILVMEATFFDLGHVLLTLD